MPDNDPGRGGGGLISQARREFHAGLLSGVLFSGAKSAPTNADGSNRLSVAIAQGIASRLLGEMTARDRLAGQRAGHQFEELCLAFLRATFPHLGALRPGTWEIRRSVNVTAFDQYAHLIYLQELVDRDPRFAAALQTDYLITPDIVISRQPEPDDRLNDGGRVVDDDTARLTSLRSANNTRPLLHASISCKWTIRSDRVQNSRTEALNLVRNRKGHLPHVMVVTGEPLPSRLAAIAMGTGDIDCVYHFALQELIGAVQEPGYEAALDVVNAMVDGKRLKDISDLPLDLAI